MVRADRLEHVEALRVAQAGFAHGALDALADHVQLALEGIAVRDAHWPRPMKIWRISGITLRARSPQRARIGRHRAPAEQRLALLADHASRRSARRRCAR